MLDPSLPWGYEMKHAALHRAGDYGQAVEAFEVMLSKMVQSPDLDVQRESYYHHHHKIVYSIRQGTVISTSAHRVRKRRFAKLSNALRVICRVSSLTRPPAVSTIELSRPLHSNHRQSSMNLYHR